MDPISKELRDFVVDFCRDNKIRNVDLAELTAETSLDLDLDLFDLSVDFFVADFVTAFEIDDSEFNWSKYGYPDPPLVYSIVRSLFSYKSDRVKRLCRLLYRPKITLAVFQQAIDTGKLR